MNLLKINLLQNILQILIVTFPLFIIIGNFVINIALILITIISLVIIFEEKKFFIFKDYFFLFLSLFLLLIFLNAFINYIDIEILFKSIGNYRYLFLTIGVYITLDNITKKNYSLFLFFNLILLIFVCLDILYQFSFNKNVFGFRPGMCEDHIEFIDCARFSGVFGTELIAGAYLSQIGLLFFFLIKYGYYKPRTPSYNYINIFLLFLFVIIFLTGERNAILIFLICLFLFSYFDKKLIKYILSTIIFVAFIFIFFQNSYVFKERYLNFIKISTINEENQLIKRLSNTPWGYHYQAGIELFLEKPLNGHGYKSFRFKCSETKIDKEMLENKFRYRNLRACSTHPHNYMIEFLSENGVLGLLFFFSLIILIFKKTYYQRKFDQNKKNFIVITLGSLILAILFPFKPSGSFFTTFNSSILFPVTIN